MKRFFLSSFVFLFFCQFVFSQELAVVRENGKFGYINREGEFAIPAQYKKARSFANGLAAVLQKGKWGYIDGGGKWIIEPKYKKVKDFNSDIALVNDGKRWLYVDKEAKEVRMPFSTKKYPFRDGVVFIRKGSYVGLANTKGDLIVDPKMDVIKSFRNGYARFSMNGFWGIMDNKGEIIIDPKYTFIGDFVNGVARAEKDGKWGWATKDNFILVEGAKKIWDFKPGGKYATAEKSGKIGFIDISGKWVIEPQYDSARAFKNGFAAVKKRNRWGYINTEGKAITSFSFFDAGYFSEDGLAAVKGLSVYWGFINDEGKMIIPLNYDIFPGNMGSFLSGMDKGFRNGIVRVKQNGNWGFLNKDGSLLANRWFKNAEPFVKIN